MDNKKIGNFIRTLRKEIGLTQKELAEKLSEWHHKFKEIYGTDDCEQFKKLARELDDEYKPYFDEVEIRTRLEIKERKEKQNGTSND